MAGSCQPLFILIQESHSDFECAASSEPGVDPCDRSSANLSESDECRFPDARVISWNMNGI